MSGIIQLLPDSIANQIAAGEVVQRPSSAVKELLENSIDAGSTKIKLNIKDAGKVLIQVIDNGCGMSDMDARMCFERHATSKIKKADDLFSIQTKGFRGEAMASIAAIAQVELKTKMVESEIGTKINIEGSELKKQEPCSSSNGSNISIKNLFFNVPARRNFLKSNPVETKHIIDEFQRVAIAHADIEFSLVSNGVEIYHLPSGNFKQRVIGVFGKNYAEKIIPIEEGTDIFSFKGYIGKPEFAKKTRGEQYFLVNDRFIKDPYLNHAIMSAYDELIPKGQYPLYVISIQIDPSKIDINVHPTKQEIKFEDEKVLYAFLNSAAKKSLGAFNVSPSLDFGQESSINDSFASSNHFPINAPTEDSKRFASSSNYSSAASINESYTKERPKNDDWKSLYEITRNEASNQEDVNTEVQATINPDWDATDDLKETETVPYQIHQTYILSHIKSGFLIIDQESCHERIKYEYYVRAIRDQIANTQQLLFPEKIEQSPADIELFKEIMPELKKLGFSIAENDDTTFEMDGIPADISNLDYQKVMEHLLEQYKHYNTEFKLTKRENLALSLAKFASIKAGQKLTVEEMKGLLDQLFACENPNFSPSGKPIFVTYGLEDLNKQFQR